MVFRQNIFPDIPHYVVQVDIPPVTDRPAAEPGMEIFITDQHDQFITGNSNGHTEMAFLI
jgi:hypothetical protein